MSDLSATLASTANSATQNLRSPEKSAPAAGSSAESENHSFSSVLKEKVAQAEKTPETPSAEKPVAQSPAEPAKEIPDDAATAAASAATEAIAQTSEGDAAASDAASVAAMLALLLQQATTANPGAAEASPATSAGTEASTVIASAMHASQNAGKRGFGKDDTAQTSVATTNMTDAGESTATQTQTTATSSTALTEAQLRTANQESLPPQAGTTRPASGIDVSNKETAITAELNTPVATPEKSAGETTTFAELLGRTQEAQGQKAANAVHSSAGSDNSLHMQHAAGHPNWSNELGDKLTWMVSSQRQQAELVLNPPQLGRIEVSLTVTGDQANAVFTSPNAAVREMIENSLPRLKEILAGSGMNLGQADVGAQSFNQQRGEHAHGNRGHGNTNELGSAMNDIGTTVGGTLNLGRPGERRGMVDVFA